MQLKSLFRLEDKVAVVFGGSGYLGTHFCKALLEYGAIVYCCDLTLKDLKDDLISSSNYKSNYHRIQINASQKDDLLKFRDTIGQIDILVNSVTQKGNDFYLPFELVSEEGWNIGLQGNLTIPFLTTQTFIPLMKEKRSGSIINVASIYGVVGNDQRIYKGSNLNQVYVDNSENATQIYSHGVYNAAKAGLINFTRYLATYYGEYNIRVNSISPGGLHYEEESAEFVAKYSAKVPLGRKASPDEINGALIYLASDASSYVTGHNLVVDGGFTAW